MTDEETVIGDIVRENPTAGEDIDDSNQEAPGFPSDMEKDFHEMSHPYPDVSEETDMQTEVTTPESPNTEAAISKGKSKNKWLGKLIRIVAAVAFVIFVVLFINEVIIEPYRSEMVIRQAQNLYKGSQATACPSANPSDAPASSPASSTSPSNDQASGDKSGDPKIQDPNRDSQGRLLAFSDLLKLNPDVKGWIIIPGTKINYPVLQSGKDDPEYYLSNNINKQHDKAGSIFIDVRSSVEKDTQNLVLYGHNMTGTGRMFHDVVNYQDLKYYKENPVISFDTLYKTGQWKIFSVFLTNGSSKYETFFDFTKSEFSSSSDFLNFVYQLRVRSLFNINVDVNESDQLLTLSTCTYELENYRTVVVARRVREGESPDVDVSSAKNNKSPLYSKVWYDTYGGTPPKVTSFEEALKAGDIDWYKPADKDETSSVN